MGRKQNLKKVSFMSPRAQILSWARSFASRQKQMRIQLGTEKFFTPSRKPTSLETNCERFFERRAREQMAVKRAFQNVGLTTENAAYDPQVRNMQVFTDFARPKFMKCNVALSNDAKAFLYRINAAASKRAAMSSR